MAKSLTRVTSSFAPPLRLLLSAPRSFSARSRVGFESVSDPELERTPIQKLEEAVHRVVVRRSQPDWILFRPGSSYWVPPRSQARGYAHAMTDLANSVSPSPSSSSSVVTAVVFASARGLPSLDYFISGTAPSITEFETNSKHKIESEDDEGSAYL